MENTSGQEADGTFVTDFDSKPSSVTQTSHVTDEKKLDDKNENPNENHTPNESNKSDLQNEERENSSSYYYSTSDSEDSLAESPKKSPKTNNSENSGTSQPKNNGSELQQISGIGNQLVSNVNNHTPNKSKNNSNNPSNNSSKNSSPKLSPNPTSNTSPKPTSNTSPKHTSNTSPKSSTNPSAKSTTRTSNSSTSTSTKSSKMTSPKSTSPKTRTTRSNAQTDPADVVSIDNFDPSNPQKITEPESLMAMKYLGIEPNELVMPSDKEIKNIKDEELQEIFIEHHQKRINKLIEQIKSEKELIANNPQESPNQTRSISTSNNTSRSAALTFREDPTLELEKKHFEKLQQMHKRDVEQLVTTILTQEKMRQDLLEKERKTNELRLQRKRELEEKTERARQEYERKMREHEEAELELARQNEEFRQKQFEKDQQRILTLKRLAEEKLKKMREYEEIRNQRVQRNRDSLQKIQEDRQARMRQKEIENQEKEIMFLERKHQENVERNAKAQQEYERKRQLLLKIRTNEKRIHEAMKKNAEMKEIEQQIKFEHFAQTQQEERENYKKKHDMKVKRYLESKTKIDQEIHEKKIKLATSDEYMNQRIAFVEQEKERKRKKKAFINKLKKEERDQNAEHVKRQQELKRYNIQQRYIMKQIYSENLENEKRKFYRTRTETTVSMEKDKKAMAETFQRQIADNNISPNNVLKIAKQYDVDIDNVYRKINNSRAISQQGARKGVKIIRAEPSKPQSNLNTNHNSKYNSNHNSNTTSKRSVSSISNKSGSNSNRSDNQHNNNNNNNRGKNLPVLPNYTFKSESDQEEKAESKRSDTQNNNLSTPSNTNQKVNDVEQKLDTNDTTNRLTVAESAQNEPAKTELTKNEPINAPEIISNEPINKDESFNNTESNNNAVTVNNNGKNSE